MPLALTDAQGRLRSLLSLHRQRRKGRAEVGFKERTKKDSKMAKVNLFRGRNVRQQKSFVICSHGEKVHLPIHCTKTVFFVFFHKWPCGSLPPGIATAFLFYSRRHAPLRLPPSLSLSPSRNYPICSSPCVLKERGREKREGGVKFGCQSKTASALFCCIPRTYYVHTETPLSHGKH